MEKDYEENVYFDMGFHNFMQTPQNNANFTYNGLKNANFTHEQKKTLIFLGIARTST